MAHGPVGYLVILLCAQHQSVMRSPPPLLLPVVSDSSSHRDESKQITENRSADYSGKDPATQVEPENQPFECMMPRAT